MSAPLRRPRLPLGLAALLLACGGGPAGTPPPSPPPSPGPAPAIVPRPSSIHFAERGEWAGLHRKTVSGSLETRYIVEANGPGLCVLDFDQDGDADLYQVDGQTLEDPAAGRSTLWRNRGDGRFEDATRGSGTARDGWGFGCAVADYDQDGWPDLFVASFGPDRLYHNLGGGRFEEVGAAAGLGDDLWGQGGAWGDYDGDGLPDLYVANYVRFTTETRKEPGEKPGYQGLRGVFQGPLGLIAEHDQLWRNRGDGSFEEASERSGIRSVTASFGMAVLFVDLDEDGRLDIYVANDSVPNFAFVNQGEGRFVDRADELGLARNGEGKPQASMGIALGDVNEDGHEDLFVTNFSDDTNTLYRNEGGGFVDDTYAAGLGAPSWPMVAWATFLFDADRDGHLDLYVANGHVYPQLESAGLHLEYPQPEQLYRGLGDGRFELAEAGDLGRSKAVHRGGVSLDANRDGRLDVASTRIRERPAFYLNETPGGGHVSPRLIGVDCNRDALNAIAALPLPGRRLTRTVFSGGSYGSDSEHRLHFGFAAAPDPLLLQVRWPCGRRESFTLRAGEFPDLVEGSGSALP